MPRYYCDYCDTYLTHDSPSVRKQHNAGYKHKANVRTYYQQFEEQQTQSLIDQRIKEHLGAQLGVHLGAPQVGAPFNHFMGLQPNLQRPRLPVMMPPTMPIGASNQAPMTSPLIPGMVRPPVLPRPVVNMPGYGATPVQPSMAPPGATSMPMQMNTLPGPPTLNPPTTASNPNGAASLVNPTVYQANATTAGALNFNSFSAPAIPGPLPTVSGAPTSAPATASQDSLAYAPTSGPASSSSNIPNMV